MGFEFMTDPRWANEDPETKKAMIASAFDDEVASDPRWASESPETQQAMWESYLNDAMAPMPETDLLTHETRGPLESVGAGLAHGGVGILESIGTGTQWLGNRLGWKPMAEAGQVSSEYWEDKAARFGPSKDIAGKNLWDNPELLANSTYWLYNVSDMVPFLAAAMIPGAGTVKALSAIPKLAKIAQLGGSIVGGFMVGGGMEAAQTYKAVLEKGGSEEEAARSAELMWLGAGALNAFGIGKILSKAGGEFKARVLKHLGAAAWEGMTEGLEEPTEVFAKYFGAYLSDQPLPNDIKEQLVESAKAALTVAPIAGITGGGASVLSGQEQPVTKPPPILAPTTEPILSGKIATAETVDDAIGAFTEEIKVPSTAEESARAMVGDRVVDDTMAREIMARYGIPIPELAEKSAEESAAAFAPEKQVAREFRARPTQYAPPMDRVRQAEEIAQAEIDKYAEPEPVEDPLQAKYDAIEAELDRKSGLLIPDRAPTKKGTPEYWAEVRKRMSLDYEIEDAEMERRFIKDRERPSPKFTPGEIDALAHEAATSPESPLPEPTQPQKEAGNYKKGHITLHGMPVAIENPRGSERKGVSKAGKPWSVEMKHHYGYFNRTEGKDGDQIDVIIGPDVGSRVAHIIDQVDPETGKFDEHKTLIGFKNKISARAGYLANYEKGWQGLGAITELPIEEFKEWIGDGTRKTEAYSEEIKEAEDAGAIRGDEKPILPGETVEGEEDVLPEGRPGEGEEEAVRQRADEGREDIQREEPGEPGGPEQLAEEPTPKKYKSWFELGRKVSEEYAKADKLGKTTILRPRKEFLDIAATSLGISNVDARRALTVYASGEPSAEEDVLAKPIPTPTVEAEVPAESELEPVPPEPAPVKAKEPIKVATGDVFQSKSGRELSPAPRIEATTDRKTKNTIKRMNQWLLDEAIKEAESTGADWNATIFKGLDVNNFSQSDQDSVNLYLFDNVDGPTKPPSPPEPTITEEVEPKEPSLSKFRAALERSGFARITEENLDYKIIETEDGQWAFRRTHNGVRFESEGFDDIYPVHDAAVEDARQILESARQGELPLPKREPVVEIEAEDTGKPAASNEVAKWVEERLYKNTPILWRELFKRADKAFGGTQAEGAYTPKDAYDAMELGVNRYILRNLEIVDVRGNRHTPEELIETLNEIIGRLPTQTKRTEEMDKFQQFSTPPSLSYAVNWAANIGENETYLEPSAGVGGLAVFGRMSNAKKVYVNELSPRRAELLKLLGFDRVFTENAEQLNNILPSDVKPTVIVMNPPFSATAGRVERTATKYGARHIEQALARLEDGGRLVAIVGRGMAMDRPTFKKWWDKIQKKYTVRANVGVSGQEYKKYGTTFDNQVIVIDKTGPSDYDIVTGFVDSVAKLPELLKGVRDDRIYQAIEPAADQPSLPEPAEEVGAIPEARPAPSPTTTGIRPGERPSAGRPTAGGAVSVEDIAEEPGAGVRPVGVEGAPPAQIQEEPEPAPDDLAPVGDRGVGGERGPVATELSLEEPTKALKKGELSDSLYEGYSPTVKITGAKSHPSPLVESAAMGAVKAPVVKYVPNIPKAPINSAKISDIQLEAIAQAGAAHEQVLRSGQRKGFFIGDGTGVGKGREIGGIIWDNWRKGKKKAVWISENFDLLKDAKRDLSNANGIGWDEGVDQIFGLNKIKVGNKIDNKTGILFASYHTVRGSGQSSYSHIRLDQQETTIDPNIRMNQIVNWLGEDFDGVIAFDESHNMANAAPEQGDRGTKPPSGMALAGILLQDRLPQARVVYVSATGATEVRNLIYASRLGLWGPGTEFRNESQFVNSISGGGVAAMELVAGNLKAMGLYTARSLSYDGVQYNRVTHELTDNQRKKYDELAGAWQIVLQNINEAVDLTNSGKQGAAMSQFWGAQQRFFNQIITTMQMPSAIKQIKKDIENGESVVLQLVNTDEAQQERALARQEAGVELEDLDMTPREALMGYLLNGFPTQEWEDVTDEHGNTVKQPVYDSNGDPVQNAEAVQMRDNLMATVASIKMPNGPLDYLMDELGVNNVAEVTGRGRRVVTDPETGKKVIQKRSARRVDADVDDFMGDKKVVLVFSGAGATGRSFDADKRVKNQRKRNHYLLQPGWRADRAVQGLGRSHRSNQKQVPEFILVQTDLKGQKRFISSIARRLDQLGALTKGQRQTGSQGIFQARDNLESEYARGALGNLIEDIAQNREPDISLEEFELQTGLKLVSDEGNLQIPNIRQFLNRMLSMKIDFQNTVFDAFSDRLDQIIDAHQQAGTLDVGIETIRGETVVKAGDTEVFSDPDTGAKARYIQVDVTNLNTKRIDFKKSKTFFGTKPGGYFKNIRSGRIWVASQERTATDSAGDVITRHALVGPSLSHQNVLTEDINDTEKWEKLSTGAAEAAWTEEYNKLPDMLTERHHIITGALLPIWKKIKGPARIFRLQTDEGEKFIGRVVHPDHLSDTLSDLGAASTRTTIEVEPETVFNELLEAGIEYQLEGNWRLKRVVVSGDERIELKGPDYDDLDFLRENDVIIERIQWETRYFIPTTDEGTEIISKIIGDHPVISKRGGGESLARTQFSTIPGTPLALDALESKWKEQGVDLRLYETNQGDIKLDHIAVPRNLRKKGLGSRAIQDLLDYADRSGQRVVLRTAVKDDSFGTTSRSRLIKFYKRFGFVENKGQNKDFRISENMYRKPASAGRFSTIPGSAGITLDDVQRMFPGQHVGLSPDGSVWVRTQGGNGLRIEMVSQIGATDAQFEIVYGRMRKPGEIVTGAYQSSTIRIQRDVGDKWVLAHESVHWMEDAGIVNARETEVLKAYIRGMVKKGTFLTLNEKDIGGREDRAQFISDSLREREGLSNPIQRIIQKIQDFIDGLVNLFHRTALGITRDIETGRIYDRGPGTGVNEFAQAPAFSLAKAIKNIKDNPAFKKWFGDSKVVDENGEPLVVYHGTDQEFEAFDPDIEPRSYELDRGKFFFTTDKKAAEGYAEDPGTGLPSGKPIIIEAYVSLQNPYIIDNSDNPAEQWDSEGDLIDRYAKEEGRDGIIIQTEDGSEKLIVAFTPTQIKSIYNRGTFDPTDSRIQFATTAIGGKDVVTFEETTEPVTQADFDAHREMSTDVKMKTFQALRRAASGVKLEVEKTLAPISTRIARINTKLMAKVRRLDIDINLTSRKDLEKVIPLFKKTRKMSKSDAADWAYARDNSVTWKINELMEKYDAQNEYAATRKMIDGIKARALDVGLRSGEIEDYWPRLVKDLDGLFAAMDREAQALYTRRIQDKATEMGISVSKMNPDMKAGIITNLILGGPTGMGGPTATKARKFKKIPPKLMPFYHNPDAALVAHIHEMNKAIEKRKFFGKIPEKVAEMRRLLYAAQTKIRKLNKQLDEGADVRKRRNKWIGREMELQAYINQYALQRDYTDNIGAYIDEMRTAGEIDPSKETELNDILKARFHERGTHGIVQTYKNFSYMDTMGSPISALTQIGDMAWAMYDAGIISALKHGAKSLVGKSRIKKADVGQDRIAQEFADPGTLGKAVSFVFKMVGLEKIDAIGKEALLNASLERYQKEAKADPVKLAGEIRHIFEGETNDVIQDLLDDSITDNVKLLVYHRLMDFQPGALSEMPQRYLDAGNGRIFYMLKTFTIKQLDAFRNEGFHKIRTGDRAEKIQGLKNLTRLAMLFVLANATADELKDWVLGRKTDFNDRVVDNLLRLAGSSKFITWKARTEGVGSALARQVLPPFKFIDSLTKDIYNAGDDKGLEVLGSVPILGKLAYWHLGRGVHKRGDLWDRRLKKHKARLKTVKEQYDRSKDKMAFMLEHRKELVEHRRVNKFQGKLNKYRKIINKLKSREETPSILKRIGQLENKRTEMIKRYLEK